MSIVSRSRSLFGSLGVALVVVSGHLLLGEGVAYAQTMFRPIAASTNMGELNGNPITKVIDGSGLSSPYISGVTALAAYNATHDSDLGGNNWFSDLGNPTGFVIFDMGSGFTASLSQFAFWNDGPGFDTRVVGFSLSASNSATFSSGVTNLGGFTSTAPGGNTTVGKEVFNFAPITARYFRMTITSNGGNTYSSFGEAAFAGSAAAVNGPEPETLALLALGIGVFIWRKGGT